MMKKQMKMMISIMIISVMLVVSIPLAYATGNTNFSVILTANNIVKRGETVEVTVELDAFTGTGKGVNSFMGDLEYDETKLSLQSSQIVAQNQWDTPMYENNKLLTAKGSMVTAKEAIMKMTFTVNPEAELGLTTIKVKNPEAANDENDFVGKDGTIDIEIEQDKLQANISEYNVNENNFITNIPLETQIKDFVENIDTNGTIEIYKGTQKITDTETNIVTGITVKISIVGTTQLEGAYEKAADINGDGNVKLSDLSKMKLYLVGTGSL